MGWLAGRQGDGDVDDFVAGERSFGPVVMYFVLGATMFSAYALVGTPQRVVSSGSDVLYVLGYGSVGLVPMFYVGARVRRLGARHGFVTQAELIGARFESRVVTALMALGALVAFLPYLLIQLKAASIVMRQVTGWDSQVLSASVVAAVVTFYVVRGGVRGVGWTNVLQGLAMLIIVWAIGLWIPTKLYGSIPAMFDEVVERAPEYLTLPGPKPTSAWRYSSEIIVSALGFAVWPHIFMKCFTARSARLVQWSVVLYPSFLFFLVPLIFLGYVAVLEGGPATDQVLLWLMELPALDAGPFPAACVAFAVLAASMSTFDALLHAGASIAVRDLGVRALGWQLSPRDEARAIRLCVVGLCAGALVLLAAAENMPVFDLLLLGYDFIVQFVPVVYAGLLTPRANRVGAITGLGTGLLVVALLHALDAWAAPSTYAMVNPLGLNPGLIAVMVNAALLVLASRLGPDHDRKHLAGFFPEDELQNP
jgi:SSS family solute:Na+ symporter